MTLARRGFWVALAILSACGGPGRPPAGQPAIGTFGPSNGFSALVDRFNRAPPDQIQVVALFSPT